MKKMKKLYFILAAFVFATLLGSNTHTLAAEKILKAMPIPQISEVIRATDGSVKLTWQKQKNITGYQISYSSDWQFKSYKTRYIKKSTILASAFKKVDISTKPDTYFRMRTYKDTNGQKTYSPWGQTVRLVVWNTKWKYAENSQIHTGSGVLYYAPHANRKKIVVAVNAGHGTNGGATKKTLSHPDGSPKITDGTNAKGEIYSIAISGGTDLASISEAEANLRIAKKVKELLLKNGYDVFMLRQNGNEQLDNVARTVMSNNRANCHIAIHFDSTTSNKGAFYVGVPNIKSYRNMIPVKNLYVKHTKLGESLIFGLEASKTKIFKSRHVDLDLTQTSYSTIPSIDIEVGDKKTSTTDANLSKIAEGLFMGIQKYFGR